MGYRKGETRQEYNARMRLYQQQKYFRRRAEAITYLGGKCVDCGTAKQLEFDHTDPKQKTSNVGELFAGASHARLYAEVAKCVLRCLACHGHVTLVQRLQGIDVLGEIK